MDVSISPLFDTYEVELYRFMQIGQVVRQPAGYSAFIPGLFPPPDLKLSESTQLSLESANLKLGRLDGVTELIPDLDFFISMYVLKESALSSQVEGTRATMTDALRAESDIRIGLPDDVDDILRHINAMNEGLQLLKELPLSLRLIRNVHEVLMTGGRSHGHITPGLFRTSQNWIGGATINSARYVPPPPYEMMRALGDLESFLHRDDDLPKLIKAGLAHAQFETIHPFLDGNGRTGRLLVTFYLCSQNVLTKPVLYLSEFFKQQRELYFDLLHSYHDQGNVEGWLEFFLEGIATVSDQAILTARRIIDVRAHDLEQIALLGRRSENGMLLLKALYKSPILTVNRATKLTGLSRANANALVNKLVELGIIEAVAPDATYNRQFVHQRYLTLFTEEA